MPPSPRIALCLTHDFRRASGAGSQRETINENTFNPLRRGGKKEASNAEHFTGKIFTSKLRHDACLSLLPNKSAGKNQIEKKKKKEKRS